MAVDVHRVDGAANRVQSPAAPLSESRPPAYLAWSVVVPAVVVFNALALDQLRAGYAALVGDENGPLENAQLLMLLLALGIFGFSGAKGLGAVRVTGALLAIVGAIAFIREVDFEVLTGVHSGIDRLVDNGLRDAFFVILGLALVLYLFQQRRYFWNVLRLGLRWQAWPFAASVCLLAASELYLDGPSSSAHFWEELVETNGYFLLVLAAWKHAGLIGDRKLDSPL